MNVCLLSGGRQKSVCVCAYVFKSQKEETKIDWMTEGKKQSQRNSDRWKYKHNQEIDIDRLALYGYILHFLATLFSFF